MSERNFEQAVRSEKRLCFYLPESTVVTAMGSASKKNEVKSMQNQYLK